MRRYEFRSVSTKAPRQPGWPRLNICQVLIRAVSKSVATKQLPRRIGGIWYMPIQRCRNGKKSVEMYPMYGGLRDSINDWTDHFGPCNGESLCAGCPSRIVGGVAPVMCFKSNR